MKKEFTGKYDQHRSPVNVDDLVTLSIPRKSRKDDLVIFQVIKEKDGFYLLNFGETMDVGHPAYKQELRFQVYKVIGNIETGVA